MPGFEGSEIRKQGLNVRQTEALVRRLLRPRPVQPPPSPETRELENELALRTLSGVVG